MLFLMIYKFLIGIVTLYFTCKIFHVLLISVRRRSDLYSFVLSSIVFDRVAWDGALTGLFLGVFYRMRHIRS
jgi:hypothetical protein